MPFAATWIEIIHEVSEAKLSKSDRERKIPYDFTYMCNLKKWYKWTYLQNRNILRDIESKLMVTKAVGEINEKFRININILLYIK